MFILSGTQLSQMVDKHVRFFQEMFPEMIKKLILCNSNNIEGIRMPSGDDIWAPGFDGIVESKEATTYICAGKSVWEIGTNKDSLKKINADWEKRNNNSLGIEKTETEFYLVVPHIWAFDNQGWSIPKWEAEHKKEWKNIHIYDANILSDWINSEPAVCAWLFEKLEETTDIDFATVAIAWKRFASKTAPAFTPSLFLNGRDNEKNKLLDLIDSPRIQVKSDTTIDSFGFCLSVFLKNQTLSNTAIVINSQSAYKVLSRFCKNKLFLINFKLDCDIIPGNRVVLCHNREDQTAKADIELCQLTKTSFDKAINEMKVPNSQAMDLYSNTHGNLLSLIRKIPGNDTMSTPRWACYDRISLLAPLVLLRNYDTQNEADCELLSFLANEKYDVILEKYNEWLNLEDAPIKRVDNHILIVNFEESWQVLRLSTISPIFMKFTETICSILSDTNFVMNGSNYTDGRVQRHIGNLFLDLIYFSYNENEKELIEQTVDKILNITPFPSLALGHLSLLSEAAPQSVANFLEKDIIIGDGIINAAFESGGYSSDYCKILLALDELVLHAETRIKACDLLINLCLKTKDRNYVLSNSPKESLLTVLCLWNDQTVLTLNEKVALIKRYFYANETYFLPIIVDLILKDRIFYGMRNGSKKMPHMPIYTDELCKAINELATLMFQKCLEFHNIVCLKKLLDGYHHFYLDTLLSASKLFVKEEYTIEELMPLNADLREKSFYANRNEEAKPWLPALEAWISVTTPADVIGQEGWLFYDYYHCHFLEMSDNDDWDSNQKRIELKRVEALRMVVYEHPLDLTSLVRCSKDDWSWGAFYARELSSENVMNIAQEAYILHKNNILYGLIDNVIKTDCTSILDRLSIDEQLSVLQNISRRDILDWLNTKEKEKAYWMHQRMREYDSNTYLKLFEYNPLELLSYYSYCRTAPLIVDIDRILQIFNTISSSENIAPNRHYSYEIDKILAELDTEGYYSEELAKICALLYEQDWLQNYPHVLKRYYFENPILICEAVACLSGKVYSQFNFNYELPLTAYNDSNALGYFVKTIVDNHSDNNLLLSILGNILGKGPNGSDGIFPHETIRDILEMYREINLNHYVMIGKLNSRGARTVEDGTSELLYAKKLKEDAKSFEVSFPETAQLLYWISEDYAAEGKHDYLHSEIGYY